MPPLLPSVNQIGFDSYDMIAGTISRTKARRASRWPRAALGDRRSPGSAWRPAAGSLGQLPVPLAGAYRHDALALDSSGLSLQFSFGSVPLRIFDVRGQIAPDLGMLPGTGLYSETTCADVPNYSVQLRFAGVCNAQDTLAASGTLLTRPYGDRAATRRPRGVRLASLQLTRPTAGASGAVLATLRLSGRARYPAARHVGSILLTRPGW